MEIHSAYSQKFFLYARKSTDVEDKQARSIDDQLSVLRELVTSENLVVIEELVEKQSAKIPGRPIFNQMISRIEKGEASGILAWHPDILARNSVDGVKIIYLLDTGKITALRFPTFWFEPTPQGKFMLSIVFGQSKYYIDSLSENTRRGLHQKAKRGEFPGCAPMGYLNDPRSKTIVIDKKKTPILIQIFELYARGNSTFTDISLFLAEHGIKTRGNQFFKIDKIKDTLTNPFYCGYFRYGGEVYEGKHEPIISKKLFDQVQEEMRKRSKPQKKERVTKVFTGLLRCGECGKMITAEMKKGHIYYRCTKKTSDYHCLQPYLREEEMDKQLSDMMQKVSLRADWACQMLKRLEDEKTHAAQSARVFVQEKREEIADINRKVQFLTDSYLEQLIDRNDYLDRKVELIGKKKTLEEQIFNLEQKQNDWLERFEKWIDRAAEVAQIAGGKDLNLKKVLALEMFGSNLVLQDRLAGGDLTESWAALRAAPTLADWVPRERIELSILV